MTLRGHREVISEVRTHGEPEDLIATSVYAILCQVLWGHLYGWTGSYGICNRNVGEIPLFVVNSLAPGRSECDSKNVIFNLVILLQRSCWGVFWFHSVRPSVPRPSRIPCPLCSFYSSGWILFIFIHLIKQLQKVCCVQSFLQNCKMWISSVGNHGAAGGISERRRSSCSSFTDWYLQIFWRWCPLMNATGPCWW